MYTDPGSGLFLAQVAMAAILTAAYRLRRVIATMFAKKREAAQSK